MKKLVLNFLVMVSITLLLSCDCSSECFPAGTMIQTPDGETPIENVKIGDIVVSYNLETGEQSKAVVTETYVFHNYHTLYTLTLADGKTIKATGDHLFYSKSKQGWVAIKSIEPGEVLLVKNDENNFVDTPVTHKVSEPIDEPVYNIDVRGKNGEIGYFAGNILTRYY